MLDKYRCLDKLAAARTDEVVVSMMSLAMPWAARCDGPLDFASVDSAMGHGADFAYGLAMAQPRRVIALNGDGSMLMCLGTLVTMAQHPVPNFTLVIAENGTYEVTGNQPIPNAGRLDFETIARGAGIERVFSIDDDQTFDRLLPEHFSAPGPQVFVWKLARSSEPVPSPMRPIRERAARLRRALRQS